jgi:hypothetical protein
MSASLSQTNNQTYGSEKESKGIFNGGATRNLSILFARSFASEVLLLGDAFARSHELGCFKQQNKQFQSSFSYYIQFLKNLHKNKMILTSMHCLYGQPIPTNAQSDLFVGVWYLFSLVTSHSYVDTAVRIMP